MSDPDGYRQPVRSAGFALTLVPAALLFLLASRRAGFEARQRVALGLVGAGFLPGATKHVLQAMGVTILPATFAVTLLVGYVTALGGVLTLAQRRLPAADRRVLMVDILMTLAAMVLFALLLFELRAVSLPATGRQDTMTLVVIPLIAGVVLVALANLSLRGVPLPSSRALRCAVLALSGLFLTILLSGLHVVDVVRPVWVRDLAYVATTVLLVFSGYYYLTDGPAPEPDLPGADWVVRYSPLPLLLLGTLAGVLLWCLVQSQTRAALLAAIGLLILIVPVLFRTHVTHSERLRLLRERAQRDLRLQQERFDASRRLAGGLAHRLNSLLTAVVGFADLALQGPVAGETRDALESISHAGRRAGLLTRQLTVYTGHVVRQRTPTRVAALVERAAATAAAAGRRVRTRVLAADVVAEIDEALGTDLITELVDHALRVSPPGAEVVLTVAAVVLDAPLDSSVLPVPAGRHVVVEVVDAGPDLVDHELPRIFEPFHRTAVLDASVGLGLATVHGITTAHEGGITVDRATGGGTRIRVYLPAVGPGG